MKLYFERRKLLVWAFVGMVFVSSINLVLVTNDYLLMYSSINQLQFKLTNMILQENGPGHATVLAQIRVDNPVNYGGLMLRNLDVSTYFESDNTTLFQKYHPLGTLANQVLAPESSTIWNVTIPLTPQNATSLHSFYQAYGAGTIAVSFLSAEVTTLFLDQVTFNPALFQLQQNMTLT